MATLDKAVYRIAQPGLGRSRVIDFRALLLCFAHTCRVGSSSFVVFLKFSLATHHAEQRRAQVILQQLSDQPHWEKASFKKRNGEGGTPSFCDAFHLVLQLFVQYAVQIFLARDMGYGKPFPRSMSNPF